MPNSLQIRSNVVPSYRVVFDGASGGPYRAGTCTSGVLLTCNLKVTSDRPTALAEPSKSACCTRISSLLPKNIAEMSTVPECNDALPGAAEVSFARSTAPNESAPTKARRDIQVRLQYLADDPYYDKVKPLQVVPGFLDREGRSNVRLVAGPWETLHDVRGRFDAFTLDDNGFKYVRAPTHFTEWTSQPKIGKSYLTEMEDLLRREVDGCDEIIFYDARIRQSSDQGLRVEGLSFNPFARQVHVDNTEKSVVEKIRNLTELKADYLLKGRARIINLWRAIKHPVYDCGLAIADGSKLRPGDVRECDRVRRDTNEYWDTMGVVQHRPGYDWYFMNEQDEDTVLLFKNYDSDGSVAARCCLHTAFDMPPSAVPPGAPTRESIEVRALVFTYPRDERLTVADNVLNSTVHHPLAESLEQGRLTRVDDDCSVVDRLCKDIDEVNEAKDAELLLRKRRIRNLEKSCDSLEAERDEWRGRAEELMAERDRMKLQLGQMRDQLRARDEQVEAIQIHVGILQGQFREEPPEPRMGALSLAGDGVGYVIREKDERIDGLKGQAEMEQLWLELEGQRREIEKWKREARGRGNEAVSRCWAASVDEAVRREREKDAFVIKAMREEIQLLRQRAQG